MHRKPSFSLSYADELFRPAMAKAFPASADTPDVMRAVLGQFGRLERVENPLAERLQAIKALSESEMRDAAKASLAWA